MASNETEAYKIMRMLDVDYVLVIFGGLSGYSSDDINKFLWMVSTPCDKTSPYVLAVGNGKTPVSAQPTLCRGQPPVPFWGGGAVCSSY
jgi:dolichyl-diphosphooligosaccharide--protein glycosyltransferase